MKKQFFCLIAAFIATIGLNGDLPKTKVADPTFGIEYKTTDPRELKDLHDSAIVSQHFVEVLDEEDFGKSWTDASSYFKSVISQEEWSKTMTVTRKPLGKLVNRQIANQRTSKNPPNLPPGDYMVLFYSTDFAGKTGAAELVTLIKENGEWKVFTYQVN